jgi:hypothetical protein
MTAPGTDPPRPPLTRSEGVQIALIALYCGALIVVPVWLVIYYYAAVFDAKKPNEAVLLGLVVAMGVLGSALRGIATLFNDVGRKKYDSSWNLSLLMRPLEGAGMALILYLAIRGGVALLTQQHATPSGPGFLFVGALAGMFSHRAVDGLRDRFDEFLKPPPKREPDDKQP